MKNIFSKILFFSPFLLIFLFLIYHYRFVYQTPFDEKYARDLFDHSQYRIPLSPRSISDELLYQVAGVDYLRTGDIFNINPEAPPLAKYLYGFSIIFFKNAKLMSIFIFIICFFIYFLILKEIFKKNIFIICLGLFLFILEPLMFHQMTIAMLDLPQLLGFLIHIYSFLRIIKEKNNIKSLLLWSNVAGLSLGWFISTKVGFFAIPILIFDFLFLYQTKNLLSFITIILTSILFFLISYLPFFIKGNDIFDFVKAQKWIIHYWLDNPSKSIKGMIVINLISGFTKGWHEGATWERINEWTITWPIYLIIFLLSLIKAKKYNLKKNIEKNYILFISLSLFLLFSLIPLFPRYLILIFPLFIIISIPYLSKIKNNLKIFLIIIFIIQIYLYLNPNPNSNIKDIIRNFTNGSYQDLYNELEIKDEKIDRWNFWRRMKLIEKDLGIDKKQVVIGLKENFYPWKNKLKGEIFISIDTKIGKIDNRSETEFIKEKGRWKMIWQDRYFIPNLDQDDQVIGNFELGRYGKILLKDGAILSNEEKRPFFLVIKKEITDDKKIQLQLAKLTGKGGTFDIEIIYRPNSLPDVPTEIGFIKEDYNLSDFNKIKLEKGVIYEMRPTRVYYSNLKKGYPTDLIKKIAWQNRNIIDPEWGGKIMIKKRDGKIIIIKEKIKKDGKDIVL